MSYILVEFKINAVLMFVFFDAQEKCFLTTEGGSEMQAWDSYDSFDFNCDLSDRNKLLELIPDKFKQ